MFFGMLKNVNVTVLANGAKVVSAADYDAESVAVGIWVGVGGRYERASQSGVSHFLEHMLFKGTGKRSALEISRAIEGRGGYLNAFTQEESTCYYTRLPYEFLPQAFDVLADMYLNAALKPEDIERERDVIIEEIKMYQDMPQQVVQEKMQEGMFRAHSLGVPLAGKPNTLARMDHDFLARYKAAAYTPAATVFAFAGRLDHGACVACVEKAFGQTHRPRRPLVFKQVDASVGQERLVVIQKDINQVYAAIGFRVFGRHDERRYTLRVLNSLLGENMSSRLFQSVRERSGLCYSIQSSYQLFAETGAFTISGGFDTRRAESALRLTAKELRRVIETKVGVRELKRAKDYLLGTFRLGLEGSGNQMMFLGESMLNYGQVADPEETIEKIGAVTPDDVMRVAEDVFTPERMTVALVVPKSQAQNNDHWHGFVDQVFAKF
jgi:predicted Zn-dependent peptidase